MTDQETIRIMKAALEQLTNFRVGSTNSQRIAKAALKAVSQAADDDAVVAAYVAEGLGEQ